MDPLQELEIQIWNDLKKINIPARPWVLHSGESTILDVAIIGAGMAGKAVSLALMKQGILNFNCFDENEKGKEGPWFKYARMRTLRSDKHYMGPALDIPSLTFNAWYEAKFGEEAFEQFELAPTSIWGEYLQWFGDVLGLPITHERTLRTILPKNGVFELHFDEEVVLAHKIVLATGQGGSGGCDIPSYMEEIPKSFYYHTGEIINPQIFKDKKIVTVGAGASAFDVSAVALENGAKEVKMLIRRSSIPVINEFAEFAFQGMLYGFYHLSDDLRSHFFKGYMQGVPPPKEAIERLAHFENFHVHYLTSVECVEKKETGLVIETNGRTFEADMMLFGTGFSVDLNQRPELSEIKDSILLWEKKLDKDQAYLATFPYLGPHFEFLEKEQGMAPYLKNIHCFNFGATLSHGLISGDVPGISIGANRLALGIAVDLFLKESKLYLRHVQTAGRPLFNPNDYQYLK